MKILIVIGIILMVVCSNALCDELRIPMSCWPKELKEAFAGAGKKLDLDPGERTDDSWAYLENKGSEYVIFVYGSMDGEDFQLVQEIVTKVEMAKRK